jgi:hypothetical protein
MPTKVIDIVIEACQLDITDLRMSNTMALWELQRMVNMHQRFDASLVRMPPGYATLIETSQQLPMAKRILGPEGINRLRNTYEFEFDNHHFRFEVHGLNEWLLPHLLKRIHFNMEEGQPSID